MRKKELPFVKGFPKEGNVNQRCQPHFALYRACLEAASGNHPAAMLIYEKINLMGFWGNESVDNRNVTTFVLAVQKAQKNGSD